jgi:hypothetical protein
LAAPSRRHQQIADRRDRRPLIANSPALPET